jgi:hypothetical protein
LGEQGVGGGDLDGEPFALAAVDVHRAKLAAVDAVEDGLAGDAESLGCLGEPDRAVGDLRCDRASYDT